MVVHDDEQPEFKEVRGRLGRIAGLETERLNDYTRDFRQEMMALLDRGARRMIADGKTSDASFGLAQDHLHEFVLAVEVRMNELGLNEARETTFAAGLRLCPLWPFC